MAERELAIVLRAKDLASRTVKGLEKNLGGLGKVGSRAFNGLTTAITRMGLAAAVGLAGGVAMGVRSLADLQRTTAQTNAVIASTGGAAGQSAESIRKHAEELENLSTVDDKVIQDGQNMLLTFTNIKGKVFPQATKATLNLAVAMAKGDASQVDMKASAIQLGKALQDPTKGVTALRKVGVAFTKDQIKQIKALQESGDMMGAQAIILRELETEFGNAAEAAGTGPAATWRRLQDVGEDLSQSLAKRLLPVLERAGTWLTTKLADPAVSAALDEIGAGLADAATEALKFVETIDFKALGSALGTAAGFAGGLVKAFMGMPEWVKVAVISGWGLNKLTGGAVGGIIGELSKGLIKGVLGMNAGVVNINAGVVKGGGLPGGIPPVAAGGAAAAGGVGLAAGLAGIAAGVAVSALAIMGLGELSNALSTGEQKAAMQQRIIEENLRKRRPAGMGPIPREQVGTRVADVARGLADQRRGERGGAINQAINLERQAIEKFTASTAPSMASMKTHLSNLEGLQRSAGTRDSTNASAIVGAIRELKAVIGRPPNIYVTASDNAKRDTQRRRTVKPHGPRGTLLPGASGV